MEFHRFEESSRADDPGGRRQAALASRSGLPPVKFRGRGCRCSEVNRRSGGIMGDDTWKQRADPVFDGALERFERAEAELEETEERRRRLAEEAARAAAELESTVDQAIRSSLAERDRLEDELAAVLDHIARLESIRARSSNRGTNVTAAAEARPVEDPSDERDVGSGDDRTDGGASAERLYELIRSREDSPTA
jgi:hypothetical protein